MGDISFKIEADNSDFLKKAEQAKQATKGIGEETAKATRPASPGAAANIPGPSGLTQAQLDKQVAEWQKAQDRIKASSKKTSEEFRRFQQLNDIRPMLAGNAAGLREIDKEQVGLMRTLERHAKTEERAAYWLERRVDLQKKLNTETFTPRSLEAANAASAKAGIVTGAAGGGRGGVFPLLIAGYALGSAGQAGQQFYKGLQAPYQGIQDQYRLDPQLYESELAKRRAQLAAGSQLSGYQQFKNNISTTLIDSPAAAPAAIIGDIAGAAANAGSAALPLIASLKLMGVGGEAGLLGAAAKGFAAIAKVLPALVKGGVEFGAMLASPAAAFLGATGLAGGVVGLNTGNTINRLINPGSKDQNFGDVLDTLKKLISLAPGIPGQRPESFLHFGGGAGTATGPAPLTPLQQLAASPEFKLHQTQLFNQIRDFQVDTGRQEMLLRRNYFRQTEDLNHSEIILKRDYIRQTQQILLQGQYAQEDHAVAQGRFAISKARLAEDTEQAYSRNTKAYHQGSARNEQDLNRGVGQVQADYFKNLGRAQEDYQLTLQRSTQDYFKTIGRAQEDYNKQLSRVTADDSRNRLRAQEDYQLNIEKHELSVYRIRRDYALQSTYLEEDYSRNVKRINEDSARNLARLEEDSGRDLTRLTEDTGRARLRATQDYTRSMAQVERDSSRSMADINRGLSDTIIGIFAPTLAASKGYQLMKALRDAALAKSRLTEDTKTAKEGIEQGKARSDEDIGRGEGRGKEDIARNLSRGKEDIERERSRALEDAAREHSRAALELLTHTTDALKDSELSLLEINRNYTRFLEDAPRELGRTIEDLNTALGRTMTDALEGFMRGMADATKALYRTTADLVDGINRSIEGLYLAFNRASEDLTTNFLNNSLDIAKSAKQSFEDITAAEADELRNFGHTMDAVNEQLTQAKQNFQDGQAQLQLERDRLTEDYKTTADELEENRLRFKRDMGIVFTSEMNAINSIEGIAQKADTLFGLLVDKLNAVQGSVGRPPGAGGSAGGQSNLPNTPPSAGPPPVPGSGGSNFGPTAWRPGHITLQLNMPLTIPWDRNGGTGKAVKQIVQDGGIAIAQSISHLLLNTGIY